MPFGTAEKKEQDGQEGEKLAGRIKGIDLSQSFLNASNMDTTSQASQEGELEPQLTQQQQLPTIDPNTSFGGNADEFSSFVPPLPDEEDEELWEYWSMVITRLPPFCSFQVGKMLRLYSR